jgi:hypothetical protein
MGPDGIFWDILEYIGSTIAGQVIFLQYRVFIWFFDWLI